MRSLLVFCVAAAALFAETTMVKDPKHGLLWEDTPHVKETKVNYTQAKAYCKELDLGGFHDWRVPTLHELLTIVDYRRYKPALKKPLAYVEDESSYWTTTLYIGDSGSRWVVNFKDGATSDASENYDRYVRCVRKIK